VKLGRSGFSKVQSSSVGSSSGQLRLKEAVHSVSIMFWSLASLSPPPPRCRKRSDVSDVSDSALDKARRAVMNVEMKYLFMFEV
jgi:hypothetical protein